MRGRLLAVVTLALGLVASGVSPAVAAETVYVQSTRAKLLAAPSFDAAVAAVAQRGDALEVLERAERWVRVQGQGAQGWVPSLVVRGTPPMAKVSLLEDTGDELRSKARRRASATSGAGAARGLTPEARQRAGGEAEADYEALVKLEGVEIPDSEVDAFLEYLGQ